MKQLLAFLFLINPVTLMSSEILYNSETKLCETETGNSKNRNSGITQCALLTKVSRTKILQTIQYRKLNGYSLNLRGIHIKDSDLTGVDFSDLDLEGAIFENVNLTDARFLRSRLSSVQFRNANLNRVSFDLSNLDGAVFDHSPVGFPWIRLAHITHRTQIPPQLRLELAQDNRMSYTSIPVPEEVRRTFPGLAVFIGATGFDFPDSPQDASFLRPILIPSLEARLQPLPTDLVESHQMGFNRADYFDVLCAARFKSCLRSRDGLASMMGLSRVPAPLLNTGLEFYHGETEDEGIGRFVSVSSIELEPRRLQEQIEIAKRYFKEFVEKNLGSVRGVELGDLAIMNPLEYVESFNVRFNFLPQPQTPTECFLKGNHSDAKLKCKVIVEFRQAPSEDPQWLQQKIQGFVRSAPYSTVQIDLELAEPFHLNLQFMTPIQNANFWRVNSDHYYSKSRWLEEPQ